MENGVGESDNIEERDRDLFTTSELVGTGRWVRDLFTKSKPVGVGGWVRVLFTQCILMGVGRWVRFTKSI